MSANNRLSAHLSAYRLSTSKRLTSQWPVSNVPVSSLSVKTLGMLGILAAGFVSMPSWSDEPLSLIHI